MKKRKKRRRNRTFSIPKIQHSLGPDESAVVKSAFRIDPHTGTLTLAAPLDREAMAQYSFTVTDPKPPITSTRVTVLVQDYNDNPPLFAKDTYVTAGTIKKHGPRCFHRDNERVLVVWSGLQVYVAAELDRERQAEYTLTLTITGGKCTANTTVAVTVIDISGW